MNSRKMITVIMLLFVVVSIGHIVYRISSDSITPETDQPAQQIEPDSVEGQALPVSVRESDANIDVVYYFMTTQRCPSCMKIESFAKEAVEQNFSKELQEKELVWRMVNVDEPASRHFIKDYELFTKSVVLVKYRDGKQVEWKNLDKVWNLLNDEAEFRQYITDEVKSFFQEV